MATISTQRVQQFRTRQRTGKILLTIEVDEVLLVEALTEARLLYHHLADDRGAITRALEKAVVAFCKEQTLAIISNDSQSTPLAGLHDAL
jgi:hypothetical protein